MINLAKTICPLSIRHSPVYEPINSSTNTLYTTIDKFASGYSGVKVSTILVAFSLTLTQISMLQFEGVKLQTEF